MKRIAAPIIPILLLFSCATAPGPGRVDIVSLKGLLRVCESDLENAKKVLVEHDLVKNLWHLQRMDRGGSKYYLLEREGITAMIKSVTEGVYADFILVSANGTVIYTMTDNSLFARNVRGAPGIEALAACHAHNAPGPFITAVPFFPGSDRSFLAVSAPVSGGTTMSGTFILLVDMEKIRSLVGDRTCIVGESGKYETDCGGGKSAAPYPDFDRIDLSGARDGLAVRRFARPGGGSVAYRLFGHANLFWIFVTE